MTSGKIDYLLNNSLLLGSMSFGQTITNPYGGIQSKDN
jgi:hypothetical protein